MSWIMLEFACPECGEVVESLEKRSAQPESIDHCGTQAPRTLSAVKGYMSNKCVASTPSTMGERPPNHVSTERIAEGMSTKQYRTAQRKALRGARIDEIRRKV